MIPSSILQPESITCLAHDPRQTERGAVWAWEDRSEEELLAASYCLGRYHYRRLGLDSRELKLLPGGQIGVGAAACEQRWSLRFLEGVPTLIVIGQGPEGSEIGMMLLRRTNFLAGGSAPAGRRLPANSIWRGRWQAFERCAVELEPLPTLSPPAWFHYRAGTWDEPIVRGVFAGLEYEVPAMLSPEDVVIDIGAHVGAFSALCLTRGAGSVYAFEASLDNFALLQQNLSPFGLRAIARHQAVWRSDEPVDGLYFQRCAVTRNTGGGGVLNIAEGVTTSAVALDAVLEEASQQGARRIRLMKLDCEGSEYPILLTSRRLDLVDALCGEAHRAPWLGETRTVRDLLEHLESQGFRTRQRQTSEHLWVFHAERSTRR